MNNKRFLAVALITFACTSATLAKPKSPVVKSKSPVQRGAVFSIQIELAASASVQAASLTWQAFQLLDPHTHEIEDHLSPEQQGMARAFLCDADVVAKNSSLEISCKVPLNVADGIYYLTAISIRTRDSERQYTWLGDLPADVVVQISGGEEVRVPHIQSIMIK